MIIWSWCISVRLWNVPFDEIVFQADGRWSDAPEKIVDDDQIIRNKANTFQSLFLPPVLHIPPAFAVKLFDPSDRSPVNAESPQWSISLFFL